MKLQVLGSNSSGNCYILSNNTESIIMELGVAFKEVKIALNFDLSKVKFALCTHGHGDHAKYVKHCLNAGIDVILSQGTKNHTKLESTRLKVIKHGEKYKAGNFEVMAFNTNHDCPGGEPLGFLIRHPECGTICFITDSFFVDYQFPDVTHFMVEANYCDQIINERLVAYSIQPAQANRTRNSHMSIATCKDLLQANDLTKVCNIILIHLSGENSDAKRFKKEVEELTMCNVEVAKKGLVMDLGLTPF